MGEYTTDKTDDYLTMHRIMGKELDKWLKEHIREDDSGHTIVRAKSAFTDGFMAGFCLKFTGETE
jgi:hemerythrin